MSTESRREERLVVIDDLVEDVCWHLLASSPVGRLGFVRDEEPWVLPFNYNMRERTVVFRTADHSMLHSLGDGAAAAVEVDNFDAATETGWSVIVRGNVWEITDAAVIATFAEGAVQPWAPGAKDRWMSVVPRAISGRAISRHPPLWRVPYMSTGSAEDVAT
jgi:nitroimidazol reductase NimA-like FMN-containing flavoprotein (pyridoxamine 5'-phosphate oxidase superfamily)